VTKRLFFALTLAAIVIIPATLTVAVLDAYMTQHGAASLRRDFVDSGWLKLSLADIMLFVMVALAALAGWFIGGPAPGAPAKS
jgi:hypothetical protein